MKRFYVVLCKKWDFAASNFNTFNSEYESKADAMAVFDNIKLSPCVPKVQVWEQLCKNNGFVQAQRRIAIKEF